MMIRYWAIREVSATQLSHYKKRKNPPACASWVEEFHSWKKLRGAEYARGDNWSLIEGPNSMISFSCGQEELYRGKVDIRNRSSDSCTFVFEKNGWKYSIFCKR